MSLDHQGHIAGVTPIEFVYPLKTSGAFKTVNAAVFATLTRLSPERRTERDEVDGATVYFLNAHGVRAQLFVMHITDHTASIRLHYVMPTDPIQLIDWRLHRFSSAAAQVFTSVFQQCHEEIVRLLRHAALVEVNTPPPPPPQNLQDVFTWQMIYFPELPDHQLAELVGVEHQTIRNARSKLGQQKRTQRGRRKGK